MDEASRWQERFCPSPEVVPRSIAGEMILVPVRGELARMQQLFVLDPVAEHIWRQLDGTRTLAAIHAEVVAAFDVDEAAARRDLLEFVAELEEAGLIRVVAGER